MKQPPTRDSRFIVREDYQKKETRLVYVSTCIHTTQSATERKSKSLLKDASMLTKKTFLDSSLQQFIAK